MVTLILPNIGIIFYCIYTSYCAFITARLRPVRALVRFNTMLGNSSELAYERPVWVYPSSFRWNVVVIFGPSVGPFDNSSLSLGILTSPHISDLVIRPPSGQPCWLGWTYHWCMESMFHWFPCVPCQPCVCMRLYMYRGSTPLLWYNSILGVG